MISRTYRQHTAGEIEILNNTQSWARFKLSDFLGISFITTILYAGAGWFLGKGLDYLSGRFIQSFETPLFAPSLLAIGLICTIVSIIRGERRRKASLELSRQRSEDALRDGRAEVIECDVDAAAELQEYEDEGPGFFLQVSPNLILFLQGQELMFSDFPTKKIGLTRDARTHCIFDLQHHGTPVNPSRTIQSQQFGGSDWLESGMFIYGNIGGLPHEIRTFPKQDDILDEALKVTDDSEPAGGGKGE